MKRLLYKQLWEGDNKFVAAMLLSIVLLVAWAIFSANIAPNTLIRGLGSIAFLFLLVLLGGVALLNPWKPAKKENGEDP